MDILKYNLEIDFLKNKEKLKLRTFNDTAEIWDVVRKKYVVLQPEELVRQLVFHWFVQDLGLSIHRIQIEKQFKVNNRKKRFDLVVYDKNIEPYILIECKSHQENIDQKVFDQIAIYQSVISAPYLLLTNGIHSYMFFKDESQQKYVFETDLNKLILAFK